MTDSPVAPPEVTRFLRDHPPFDALPPEDVERVAATAEVEFHRAGTTIFSQGAEPVTHLRVIRRGAVEIVHDGRVLDELGEGELFGHASMLSGLPTGFAARASEDTLCYRVEAEVAKEMLGAPAGLRYVARSLLEDVSDDTAGIATVLAGAPAEQPVGALIGHQPVICEPESTIREAARQMTAQGATAVVIRLADGSLGILTDHDLRERVLADGLSGDARVFEAMSAPAYTCEPDRPGSEVLLDMLDRGVRHLPVVAVTGEVLGVVEDRDLVAVHARTFFALRQRINRAQSTEDLVGAARDLDPTVVAMSEARMATGHILAVRSALVDSLTRRLLEFAVAGAERTPPPFAWLALGSQARREATPSADLDSAIVWFGEVPDAEAKPSLLAIGRQVVGELERCGLPPDEHGATAAGELFVRSLASWQRAARSWIADPGQEKALLLTSVLVDSRPVWGLHMGTPVADTFRPAPDSPALLRMMARFALSYRPPTGFLRGLVVEDSGEHRGRLDLKHGGVIPIVDLGRWAGMAAGVTSASTVERLRAAAHAGTLTEADAATLEDAFELICGLRLRHQVDCLRRGQKPDDFVDPAVLSPLMRSHLKEAFRAIASIQKRIAAELNVGAR